MDLYSNEIQELPSQIGHLHELRELDLKRNMLATLPHTVSTLTSLRYIDLSHNEIANLPPAIGKLTCLLDLDLSCNTKMRSVQRKMGELCNLTSLNLSSCGLIGLPVELSGLTSLQHLSISHNRLDSIPIELALIVPTLASFACEKNPMKMMPEKWCKDYLTPNVPISDSGYTENDVTEYLAVDSQIYPKLLKVWQNVMRTRGIGAPR